MEVSQLLSDNSSEGRESSSAGELVPPPPRFTIEIYSDTICPWCYLGKKHLDRAIALYQEQNPDAEFSITWKPFMLNPNAKVSDRTRRPRSQPFGYKINGATEWRKEVPFISRLGPQAPAFFERLAHVGATYGIRFDWEGTTGNSRDSHKLILLAMDQDAAAAATKSGVRHPLPSARQPSPTAPASSSPPSSNPGLTYSPNTRQNATVLTLYRGMFEQGRDVSDRTFLIEVALQVGLVPDAPTALAWLDNPEAGARVDAEFARAKAIGIHGVPGYVVQGWYRVGGMQEPPVFLGLFDKIRARELGRSGEVVLGEMAKGTMVMPRGPN